MTTAKSYSFTPMPWDYHYDTIPERMKYFAETKPDNVVYIFRSPDGGRDTITARELYGQAICMASSLAKIGIKKGDVVACVMQNDKDALVSTFGIICSGAIVLNLLMTRSDGRDVADAINRTGAKCLILYPGQDSREFNGCMQFIESVKEGGEIRSSLVPTLKHVVLTHPIEGHNFIALQDLVRSPGASTPLPRLDPEDTFIYHCTSGSTGEPKFVPSSHHAAMILGHQEHEFFNYIENDIIYNERRMAWIGGFPYILLHNAATVVTKIVPLPSLSEHCKFTYDVLRSENCTAGAFLPATIVGMLDIMASKPPLDKPLLRVIHTGGLPVSSVCMNAIGTLAEEVNNTYGSSEAGFVTNIRVTIKADFVDFCAGRPLPGNEVKVVDKDGFVVPRGETGFVHVRSPGMFSGYLDDEVKTKEVLSASRWMNTDDVGYMTRDGSIVIQGRASEIILQGGKYHVPSMIEADIKTHPDVLDVIVVAIPDDSLFELVCACVLPKSGSTITADDISKFYDQNFLSSADEAFSRFRPAAIVIMDSFPKVYTGKPDKRAVRRMMIEQKIKRMY